MKKDTDSSRLVEQRCEIPVSGDCFFKSLDAVLGKRWSGIMEYLRRAFFLLPATQRKLQSSKNRVDEVPTGSQRDKCFDKVCPQHFSNGVLATV